VYSQTILKLPLPEYMTKTVPKCNFNWQKLSETINWQITRHVRKPNYQFFV